RAMTPARLRCFKKPCSYCHHTHFHASRSARLTCGSKTTKRRGRSWRQPSSSIRKSLRDITTSRCYTRARNNPTKPRNKCVSSRSSKADNVHRAAGSCCHQVQLLNENNCFNLCNLWMDRDPRPCTVGHVFLGVAAQRGYARYTFRRQQSLRRLSSA